MIEACLDDLRKRVVNCVLCQPEREFLQLDHFDDSSVARYREDPLEQEASKKAEEDLRTQEIRKQANERMLHQCGVTLERSEEITRLHRQRRETQLDSIAPSETTIRSQMTTEVLEDFNKIARIEVRPGRRARQGCTSICARASCGDTPLDSLGHVQTDD